MCGNSFPTSKRSSHRGESFAWPFTQEDLADILGLTSVHINRILGRLRRENLLVIKNRQVAIVDLLHLRRTSGFDSTNRGGVGWSN
ncbi:helix-turn-helix domain-containing protein [Sphingomonas aerophila]|uniref:Crp/Fnr family transcriptional regulator n=1 Tax=Sphingomonas aerophila TaxID=1344948 RepID=UPI0016175C5F